jgi:endonuclease/exonuclease/phosphatase family metal-dependent hydrolase
MGDRNKLKRMRIFFLLATLLGVWTLFGLFCADAAASDANGLELHVMTFNIRYGTANDGDNSWDNRKDMVCNVLRRHDPDIVGLQEALHFQIDYIRAALPKYGEIGVGREDGKTQGEYSAILYRKDRMDVNESGTFWLSDTPTIPGSKSWGNQITRICTWGRFSLKESSKPFYLFNTHLDHQSQLSREKSVVLLDERIATRRHPDPVIVTGDFNAGEDNPAIRFLKREVPLPVNVYGTASCSEVFVDTFRVLHPNDTEVGTFNAFKGDHSGEKIDYILVQPGRMVLDAAILYDNDNGRYPSDHFPVMAKLSLRGGTSYYIDSNKGSDENDGKSRRQAWKTLDPVNAHHFEPGDRIIFMAGTVCKGPFKPHGSGVPGYPIIVWMEGMTTNRPRIEGRGIQDAILLENVEYWEINDLEITHHGPTRADWRTGVRISANNCGTLHHIHLKDLSVHDVNGSLDKSREGCGIIFECKGRKPSRFNDLLIEGCFVMRTDRNGICGRSSFTSRDSNWFPSLNVVIRHNRLTDIGGDCIKPWGCDGCLVEHNIVRGGRQRAEDYAAGIWPWSCDNTMIQFNEVSGMKGTKDGQGFDSDYNCRNSLFQYNYSHDNDGGFMLICSPAISSRNIGCEGTVIRYNISQNDGARIFHIGGRLRNTKIYNNVFYVPEDRDIYAVLCTDWDGWAENTYFYNNIFYVDGKVRYEFGYSENNIFEHNVFYGTHKNRPNDPSAILVDPMFIKVGSGAEGLKSLKGYKLKPGSLCIDAGRIVENCGEQDFWGSRLQDNLKPDIGAQAVNL